MDPKTVIVEGWRGLPHSYAIVSQFYCLGLLQRRQIKLFHRDVPLFNENWAAVPGLFDAADDAALHGIPSPPPGFNPDVTLRTAYPINFARTDSRLVVCAASELAFTPSTDLLGNQPLRQALSGSNAILVTFSRWARCGFINAGMDKSRIFIVPHGFDPRIYHPCTPQQRDGYRKHMGWEGFVFLNVGAMSGNKGIPILLKAFAQVSRRHPHALLALKGLGALYETRSKLDEYARQLSQSDLAQLQGRLKFNDSTESFAAMARLYQAADAYVAPYLAEGFNLPVLEAAACGLPVICTAGGPTDDFTTGEFAFYIPSTPMPVQLNASERGTALYPDLDGLIAHMNRLIEDPALVARAGATAQKYVLDRFTWKHTVDQLLPILLGHPAT